MLSSLLLVCCTAVAFGYAFESHWIVGVKTADTEGADTDAQVFLQIFGTNGTSRQFLLDNEKNNFERDSTDVFELVVEKELGTPTAIRLWRDDAGHSPDWKLVEVMLGRKNGKYFYDPNQSYKFQCNCWVDNTDGLEVRRTDLNWRARITTSDFSSAGTDGKVSMIIIGDQDRSRSIDLDNPEGNNFERGSTDSFTLSTVDIGTPSNIFITIRSDGNRFGWHLDKIVLENLDGAETYTFECSCWVDLHNQEETTRVIQVNN